MRKIIPLFILLFTTTVALLCNNAKGQNDTTVWKAKLIEYNSKIKDASIYEEKAQAQLKIAEDYKNQAQPLLDSTSFEGQKVKLDPDNAPAHLALFNKYYNMSLKYTDKADSVLRIAQAYKDTSDLINAKAEVFYKQIAEEYKKTVPTVDTTKKLAQADKNIKENKKNIKENKKEVKETNKNEIETNKKITEIVGNVIYVVQLGAGYMHQEYFSKAKNVEVITPSDHIKRYIVGRFKTKDEALEYRKQMIELGFKDAFVRTLDSLKY